MLNYAVRRHCCRRSLKLKPLVCLMGYIAGAAFHQTRIELGYLRKEQRMLANIFTLIEWKCVNRCASA